MSCCGKKQIAAYEEVVTILVPAAVPANETDHFVALTGKGNLHPLILPGKTLDAKTVTMVRFQQKTYNRATFTMHGFFILEVIRNTKESSLTFTDFNWIMEKANASTY